MKFLLLETSKDELSVILFNENNVEEFSYNNGKVKHNKVLLNIVEDILTKQGLDLKDLDFFATNVGPGSFTGIRLGVTTLNAFHLSTKLPLIEYNSFEPYGLFEMEDTLVLLDAGHSEYYAARFENGIQTWIGNITQEELDKLTIKKIYISSKNIKDDEFAKLLKVVMEKYEKRHFKTTLIPLYIKKSQAEREKEKTDANK